MAKDYKINEGNMIGAMPAEFDANTNLQQKVLKASADIKKGQVVIISGDMTVAPSTEASASVLGVAMFDAKEGDPVSVETEGLFRLTAYGTIKAGAQVESAADGKVAIEDDPITKVIGIALNTASNGEEVFVKFSI
jgi:predicted RecA/RadA family phage recombinase